MPALQKAPRKRRRREKKKRRRGGQTRNGLDLKMEKMEGYVEMKRRQEVRRRKTF